MTARIDDSAARQAEPGMEIDGVEMDGVDRAGDVMGLTVDEPADVEAAADVCRRSRPAADTAVARAAAMMTLECMIEAFYLFISGIETSGKEYSEK